MITTAYRPTVISNKKYIDNARIPVIFFISDFENMRKPHNAKGKLGTPNKIIVRINVLLKEYDAKIPGKSIAHPNASCFALKNNKTNKEYKRIPNNAPAHDRGRPNNFGSEAGSLLSWFIEDSFIFDSYLHMPKLRCQTCLLGPHPALSPRERGKARLTSYALQLLLLPLQILHSTYQVFLSPTAWPLARSSHNQLLDRLSR